MPPSSSAFTPCTPPRWLSGWGIRFKSGRSRGRYHGGRRPSSDDSFHSPAIIPPSALNKPSIMKRYHCRRTCSHTSPRRLPTMVTLHETRFVECQWWNDGWTVKTVNTWRSLASMILAPGFISCLRRDFSRSSHPSMLLGRWTTNIQTPYTQKQILLLLVISV